MALPKTALRKSKLSFPKGEASQSASHSDPQSSANKVECVTFIDFDGKEKNGFFKPLHPKKYPELLAKFSVGASVLMRLSLGAKAAEDRLVYDDNDNIIGTLSIAIDHFKPFNLGSDGLPADPTEKEKVCPSHASLIKYNIIEIIFFSWFLGEDDLHPKNMGMGSTDPLNPDQGFYARIDWDMLFYTFTEWVKGPRGMGSSPKGMILHDPEDFKSLPDLKDQSRNTHWATFHYPANLYLPKRYPNAGEFLKLAKNPTFIDSISKEEISVQEQLFTAALKALLTWQPDIVEQRLHDALGDEPLNYSALPPEYMKALENIAPDIFNSDKNSQRFAECMKCIYQKYYDSLYRCVVEDLVKGENIHGTEVPAFYEFLYQNPNAYKSVEAWIEQENARLVALDTDISIFTNGGQTERAASVWPLQKSKLSDISLNTLENYIKQAPKDKLRAASHAVCDELKRKMYLFRQSDSSILYQIRQVDAGLPEQIKAILQKENGDSEQDINDLNLIEHIRRANPHRQKAIINLIPIKLPDDFVLSAEEIFQAIQDEDRSLFKEEVFGHIHPTLLSQMPSFKKTQLLPETIAKRYHKIWRDAFTKCINEIIKQTQLLSLTLQMDLTSIESQQNMPLISCEKKPTEEVKDSADLLVIYQANKDEINLKLASDREGSLRPGLLLLLDINQRLHDLTEGYLRIPHDELMTLSNSEYLAKIRALSEEYAEVIKFIEPHSCSKRATEIYTNLTALLHNFNFQQHLTIQHPSPLQELDWSSNYITQPHTENEVVNLCVEKLFLWTSTIPSEAFEGYIDAALEKYERNNPSNYIFHVLNRRNRREEVTEYIKKSRKENSRDRLAYIIASAAIGADSALNKEIVQVFISALIENTKYHFDFSLQSVEKAMKTRLFDCAHYSKAIFKYAKKGASLNHSYTEHAMQSLNILLYEWVDNIEPSRFVGIIKSSLAKYESKKSYFTKSRRAEVDPLLASSDKKSIVLADKASIILAKILKDRAFESTSLNSFIFDMIVEEIKKEGNQPKGSGNRRLQEEDYVLFLKLTDECSAKIKKEVAQPFAVNYLAESQKSALQYEKMAC